MSENMNSLKHSRLFLLVHTFFVILQYTPEAAAVILPIATPREGKYAGVCASPGGLIQMNWKADDALQGQNITVDCKRQDGTGIRIEDEEKYHAPPECCGGRCKLAIQVTMDNMTPADEGTCLGYVVGADGQKNFNDNSKMRILVRNYTVLSLSKDSVNLTLGQESEVIIRPECDFKGSVSIFKVGESTALEHRSEAGPDHGPYLRVINGYFPALHFPNASCRDEGTYHIMYETSRHYEPITTTLYLNASACDTCCPRAVMEFTQNASPTDEAVMTAGPQRDSTATTTTSRDGPCMPEYIGSGISVASLVLPGAVGMLLFFVILCVYLACKNYYLTRNQASRVARVTGVSDAKTPWAWPP